MKRVSRGGEKLDHALKHFNVSVKDHICADLGSNVGGFVECLLEHGAQKVFSVDTSYGTLAWKLRQDPRVVVQERSNALHFRPEESVSFVSIDVGWTPQNKILPAVWKWLSPDGSLVSLLKPQYESSDDERRKGCVLVENLDSIVSRVLSQLDELNFPKPKIIKSPILGGKGNVEYLLYLEKPPQL